MFGEEVWLKAGQDQTCRLYGCPHVGQEIVFLHGRALPARAIFCKRHAKQIAERELFVGGVARLAN